MKHYTIPGTDLNVSQIGYGCMGIGGRWDKSPLTDSDRKRAAAAVNTALDQGINFFDHADIYMLGKSETVFADIMKNSPGLRKEIILQSKCGIRFQDDPRPGVPFRYDFSYAHIISSVDGSLQRLQTDYLDILLLHRPDPLVEPEEVARAFDELQRNGKVRYFGISNHTAGQIALLKKYLNQPLIANQVELNLLHNHLINDGVSTNIQGGPAPAVAGTLDYCRANDIMIQAWAPVANGRLIDPPADAAEKVLNTVKIITALAEEKSTSKEAIVLAWLLRHPAGIQPIIGTVNPQRIIASSQADQVMLSREEWYSLFTAARGKAVP